MKLGIKLNFRTIAYGYGVLRSHSENIWLSIFGKMVIVSKKWPRLFRNLNYRTRRLSSDKTVRDTPAPPLVLLKIYI